MICASYIYAQSSVYEAMIPENKKENFELIKSKILKRVENDKTFKSEKSRIEYAECMAYSEIMYDDDNYYEFDCSSNNKGHIKQSKSEKALKIMHPKGRYR